MKRVLIFGAAPICDASYIKKYIYDDNSKRANLGLHGSKDAKSIDNVEKSINFSSELSSSKDDFAAKESNANYEISGRSPNCDFVIAADGGLDVALSLGLKVDYYVGDNDSLRHMPMLSGAKEILPTEKDFTDFDAAVTKALSLKPDEILFFGASGGRLDHHQGALGQLERVFESGINCVMVDKNNEIRIIDGKFHSMKVSESTLPYSEMKAGNLALQHHEVNAGEFTLAYSDDFKYFGIAPLDYELKGVEIKGAKYEIPSPGLDVKRTSSLLVSNEQLKGVDTKISLKDGRAYLIRSGRKK